TPDAPRAGPRGAVHRRPPGEVPPTPRPRPNRHEARTGSPRGLTSAISAWGFGAVATYPRMGGGGLRPVSVGPSPRRASATGSSPVDDRTALHAPAGENFGAPFRGCAPD